MTAGDLIDRERETAPAWRLDALAGRFAELSGGPATSALSLVADLVLDAQQRGCLAVWIGGETSAFFPPDWAAAGIDLAAFPAVRAKTAAQAYRAADMLMRSGAFALVVLDGARGPQMPLPIQSRLTGLAKHHGTALVYLTPDRKHPARGSLASFRGRTEKSRADHDCFVCELYAEKDKRCAPGWRHKEYRCGTDGLC